MSSKVDSQSQGRVGTVGRIQGTLAQLWAKRNSSYFDSECFPSFLGGLHSDSSVRDSGHVAELVTDLPRRALVVQVRLAHLKFNFKINFSVFSAIQWASSQIREDNMYSYPAQVLASSWYGTHASLPPRHPTSDNADDQGVIVTTVIRGAPDVRRQTSTLGQGFSHRMQWDGRICRNHHAWQAYTSDMLKFISFQDTQRVPNQIQTPLLSLSHPSVCLYVHHRGMSWQP